MKASTKKKTQCQKMNQEDETEKSLSDLLQRRRQISRIHENVAHPSNRTLVRVLRFGGAKVGLDLFFLKHVHWSAAWRETLRNAYRNNWLRSYGRPGILVVDQHRSLCSGIFAEKAESDGTRRSDTP